MLKCSITQNVFSHIGSCYIVLHSCIKYILVEAHVFLIWLCSHKFKMNIKDMNINKHTAEHCALFFIWVTTSSTQFSAWWLLRKPCTTVTRLFQDTFYFIVSILGNTLHSRIIFICSPTKTLSLTCLEASLKVADYLFRAVNFFQMVQD